PALDRPGVCGGDDTGNPLAFRELDHISSHLLDLRDGPRRAEYPDDVVRAGFACGAADSFCGRSCRDLPSRHHPVYSSSTCALIPRPIHSVFPGISFGTAIRPSFRSDSLQTLFLEEPCIGLTRFGWRQPSQPWRWCRVPALPVPRMQTASRPEAPDRLTVPFWTLRARWLRTQASRFITRLAALIEPPPPTARGALVFRTYRLIRIT